MSVASEGAEQLLVEVLLNGQRVGLIGGSEFRLLSVGIVRAHARSIPTLSISGLRSGYPEYTDWRSHRLSPNDKVGVICKRRTKPSVRIAQEPLWPIACPSPEPDFTTKQAQISVAGAVVAMGRVEGDAHLQASVDFRMAVALPRLQVGCMRDLKSDSSESWIDVSFPTDCLLEFFVSYE